MKQLLDSGYLIHMKIYRTKKGIVIHHEDKYYRPARPDWDVLVNRSGLFTKLQNEIKHFAADPSLQQETGNSLRRADRPARNTGIRRYLPARAAKPAWKNRKMPAAGIFTPAYPQPERLSCSFPATAYRTGVSA